jgi:hypothetical protein
MSSMKFSLRIQKKVSISAKFNLSIWICCVLWVTCTQWSAAQATLTETGVETTLTIEQREFTLVEFERNSAWVRLQARIGENSIEDLVNVNSQVTQ